jgi:hypothetical protein
MVKLVDIPPMQYFSLVRAAQLLSLEIDDLAHLIEIGVVWPMVRIENYEPCALEVSRESIDDVLDLYKYCLSLPPSGIGVISCLKLEERYLAIALSDMRELYLHKVFDFESCNFQEIPAHISGYWMASKYHINYVDGKAASFGLDKVESIILEESELEFKKAEFEAAITLSEIGFQNILISREELLNIREAILKGDVLDGHYILERGLVKKYQPAPSSGKQTFKQALMIKGLISLLPSVDSELLNSPHKLHSKLDELFRDADISYPVSDGKTLKDWLEKAKS